MSIVNNNSVLKLLDLIFHIDDYNTICGDMYPILTNSFTYVLPSTCYPKNSINKVSKGIALRLKRISNSDEKLDIRSSQYQHYLIARDLTLPYFISLTLVNKHSFYSARNMSRSHAIVKYDPKSNRLNVNLVYNAIIKNLLAAIRNDLPILYSDPETKIIFPEVSINITYKRGKSLRELMSPSMFPRAQAESHSMVSKCKSKRCDIYQNYLVCKNKFTCTVTGQT